MGTGADVPAASAVRRGRWSLTPFQYDPDHDDEDEDQDEHDDEELDQDTQDILQALREEAEANDQDDVARHPSSDAPARSFGDLFWEKNLLVAITVTKYLGATCIVLVFLFFVTLVLKAFAFR